MDTVLEAKLEAPCVCEEAEPKPRKLTGNGFGPDDVLVLGNLKSGKSTLFAACVGRRRFHVASPGSSAEWPGGELRGDQASRLIDAPGLYSLQERSEDASAIREVLIKKKVKAVLLVLDAKNLKKGLSLAIELAEFELPVAVALNMCDEARQRGVEVSAERLAELLGVAVVPTVATERRNLQGLRRAILEARPLRVNLAYPAALQPVIQKLCARLSGNGVTARGLTYSLLAANSSNGNGLIKLVPPAALPEVARLLAGLTPAPARPNSVVLAEAVLGQSDRLVDQVVLSQPTPRNTWSDRIGRWARDPLTGVPIAIGVLAAIYLFVGKFGAGFLVDLLEGRLFKGLIMPVLDGWVAHLPWTWLRQLLMGDFGLLPMGLVLSLGVVLPALATFFFAFAVLEDSGYLPRLSLLADRALRHIGLNGKGVLPLVTGFSCITMAMLTTRVLDSRKQRIIATLLLFLAFPCAPMLAVMMVMLAKLSFAATPLVFGLLLLHFLLVGFLAKRLIRGKQADFVLELPPLRLPRLRNTLHKTGQQVTWFLREAIPYFVLGALAMSLMEQLGVLQALRDGLRPVSESWLGLPPQSADAFFMAIAQRGLGAAELSRQVDAGLYSGLQVAVALFVMTLFVPCINSIMILFKERGFVVATAILLFVLVYAIGVGGLTGQACTFFGVAF